jgi:tRNA pseudouridine38-40 synthase
LESAGEEKSSPTRKQKGKEKQKTRSGRGQRSREEVEREPQLDADGNPIPKPLRYPKRQCALLLGFCGSGFNGMQMYMKILLSCSDLSLLISCFLSQPDVRTIEGVLFNALVKVGAVSQDNADNPTKVNTPMFNLRLIQSHDII